MMLSSVGQRGDAARCREVGIAAYLTKPIRKQELREAILKALGYRAQVREAASCLTTRHSLREARRKLCILVAEDNPVNQRLAARLLQKQGHAVSVVGNGREALGALEEQSFDLVLMDVEMPEMGGFEATVVIRERDRITGMHLPIVALTAHAMKADEERCLAAGMDGYIPKPIQAQHLIELIEEIVDGHAQPSNRKSMAPKDAY